MPPKLKKSASSGKVGKKKGKSDGRGPRVKRCSDSALGSLVVLDQDGAEVSHHAATARILRNAQPLHKRCTQTLHSRYTHGTHTAQHGCTHRLLRLQERLAPRFRPDGSLAYRNQRPLLPNASQVTVIASARSRFAYVDVYRYDPAADKATKHVCELLSTCITTQPERQSEQGAATEIQRIMRGRTLARQLTSGSGQLPAAAAAAAAAAEAAAAQRQATRAEAGEEARRRWEHAEALWKKGGDGVRDQLVQVAEQQALIQGDPLEAAARGIKMAIRANLMTLVSPNPNLNPTLTLTLILRLSIALLSASCSPPDGHQRVSGHSGGCSRS